MNSHLGAKLHDHDMPAHNKEDIQRGKEQVQRPAVWSCGVSEWVETHQEDSASPTRSLYPKPETEKPGTEKSELIDQALKLIRQPRRVDELVDQIGHLNRIRQPAEISSDTFGPRKTHIDARACGELGNHFAGRLEIARVCVQRAAQHSGVAARPFQIAVGPSRGDIPFEVGHRNSIERGSTKLFKPPGFRWDNSLNSQIHEEQGTGRGAALGPEGARVVPWN